jgi:2-phosphosulfolactate phosphatase
MTTTNGTRAIVASLEAERLYIASFANLRATSEEISVQFLKKDHGHSVHIVCAGTEGYISLEDSLLAGALTSRIAEVSDVMVGADIAALCGNDEALMVASQWSEVERRLLKHSLSSVLSMGRGGQNVQQIGRTVDIADSAEFDSFHLVAELCRDPLRIVAV